MLIATQALAIGPPAISSLTPATGPDTGGMTVLIAGASFSNVSAVSFGGVPATSYVVDTVNQITAVSPAHAAGVVDV